MAWLFLSFVSAIITGILGSYVANEKGRSGGEGFILGFLFSLLGVIIVALLPTKSIPGRARKDASGGLEPWPQNDPLDAPIQASQNVSEEEVMKYLDDQV